MRRKPKTYLGKVQVDLVAVEVGVEGRAVGIVHADGALALQDRSGLSV